MIFKTNRPFTGNVQMVLDFLASFLMNAEFDIERRGEKSLAAVRSLSKLNEEEKNWEPMARRDNLVRRLNRIEVRYEAAVLWTTAESAVVTTWRRIAIGALVIGPCIILRMLYLFRVGRLRDDDGRLVAGTGFWIGIAVIALFKILCPVCFVSIRKRTWKAAEALLDNAVAMAGRKN